MKTIRQTRIDEMASRGYKLAGETSGTLSYRKGSNLARKLEALGLTRETAEVRTGARAGQHKNDGYELLIFAKE